MNAALFVVNFFNRAVKVGKRTVGNTDDFATAKEFKVFYEKIPTGSSYTLSHTATSFVFDTRGVLRLGLSPSLTAKQCTEDLLTVMSVC